MREGKDVSHASWLSHSTVSSTQSTVGQLVLKSQNKEAIENEFGNIYIGSYRGITNVAIW